MFSSANIIEIQGLLGADISDPHHVLGMHEVTLNEKTKQEKIVLAVRAFIPGAAKVTVLDPSDKNFACPMDIIHVDGFFETIIPNRTKWFRYMFKIEMRNGILWTTYDPYSFMPVMSEYDLYLFAHGTNYKAYEKLGAVPMTVDGIAGVLFSVWAPNAKRVSVIGQFNNWDGRRNIMRLLADSGVWEIFIPGLSKYDKYKFEIKTPTGQVFEKSDPYGKMFDIRPSTAGLIFDINGYNWQDEKWLEQRTKNNPLHAPVNIYEVHLGSWKRRPDGSFLTYRELADQLSEYLVDMNYTHVELMPISEYPYDESWGYQVTGYFAPTSRYGSPHDFMYFVDTMHKNGIGVILDWVPAHFPKDAHGLCRFDGSALYEHDDPRLGSHLDWGTLIFNFDRKEVVNFLIASALFWIEMYHIDGLRVDAVASMIYLDYGKKRESYIPNKYGGRDNIEAVEFLKHLNSIVLGKYPNVMMIAEESTDWKDVSRPPEVGGLGFNFKWNMGWMNDFLFYMAKDPIHRKYHHNNLTFGIMYAYNENFILVLSHDEVVHLKRSLIDKMPGDLWRKCANLRTSLTFMQAHPGKKLLFMGGEFGQFSEWSESRSLDWFLLEYPHHRQIKDYVKDLNKLYLSERALWYNDFSPDGFEWIDCDDAERSFVVFMRKSDKPEETIIIACNFTPNPIYNYRLSVPFLKEYTEILNSDDLKYGGSGLINSEPLTPIKQEWYGRPAYVELTLPPLGATIIKAKE